MSKSSTNDQRAGSEHAIDDLRLASGFAVHTARRRMLSLVSPDRPVALVQVDRRQGLQQIHVRFVVGIDGTDIAPILVCGHASAGTPETIGVNLMFAHHRWNNVFPEIV